MTSFFLPPFFRLLQNNEEYTSPFNFIDNILDTTVTETRPNQT